MNGSNQTEQEQEWVQMACSFFYGPKHYMDMREYELHGGLTHYLLQTLPILARVFGEVTRKDICLLCLAWTASHGESPLVHRG